MTAGAAEPISVARTDNTGRFQGTQEEGRTNHTPGNNATSPYPTIIYSSA